MKKQSVFMSPERLTAFSDGVIAIAITLLVLNLDLPDNCAELTFSQVFRQSLAKFDSWLISFWIIGGFWIAHHKLFNRVKQVDMTILWLNLPFLLIITSISWMVSLIEAYPDDPQAVAVFSLVLGFAGLVHFRVYSYLLHKGLFHEDEHAPKCTFALLSTPVTAVFSIGCAYIFSPSLGLYVWLLRHLFLLAGKRIDKMFYK